MIRKQLKELSMRTTTEDGEVIEYFLPMNPSSLPVNDKYSVAHQGEFVDLFEKETADRITTYISGVTDLSTAISGGSDYAPNILINTDRYLGGKYLKSVAYIHSPEDTEPLLIGTFNFISIEGLTRTDYTTPDNQLYRITPNVDDFGVLSTYMLDGTDSRVEFLTEPDETGMIFLQKGQSISFDTWKTAGSKRCPMVAPKGSLINDNDIGAYWNGRNTTISKNPDHVVVVNFEMIEKQIGLYNNPDLAHIDTRISVLEENEYLPLNKYTESTVVTSSVNNDGSLLPTLLALPNNSIPSDFDKYSFNGESKYKGNFYVTAHTNNYNSGYIFITNEKGDLLYQKKTNAFCHLFKREINKAGQNRFCYLETITNSYPTSGNVGFYENCELVIMDENFIEIDRIRCPKHGNVPEGYPVENHEYMFIDDGHYMVATYYRINDTGVYHNTIAEMKYGKCIWYIDTNDYQELKDISHVPITGSADYAHVNSFVYDVDGNLLISYRNIGLVKINKATKEVMWVIGTNRNDFTGIETRELPYQQHDIQLCKDGSFTIFDNYGHESKSRIGRYYLDETTMTGSYVEYVTNFVRSNYMGSAKLVDYSNDTFEIAYGSGWDLAFEEFNFKDNTQNAQMNFDSGYDLYRIWKDVSIMGNSIITKPTTDKTELGNLINEVESLNINEFTPESWESSNIDNLLAEAKVIYSDENATQLAVNEAYYNLLNAKDSLISYIPTSIYSQSNVIFDGTNYIDTGIKPFENNESFSFIAKITLDESVKTNPTQQAMIHALFEKTPWDGFTLQTSINNGAGRVLSLDVNLNQTSNNAVYTTDMDWLSTYNVLLSRNAITGETIVATLDETGDNIIQQHEIVRSNDTGDFKQRTIILGAANMSTDINTTTIGRHIKGTLHNFDYFDSAISLNSAIKFIKQ